MLIKNALVSFISSYTLSVSPLGFPELQGEGFDGGFPFGAECFKGLSLSGCGSPYLLSSGAGGSFSDDG